MTEKSLPPRFLRDKRFDLLVEETQALLDRLARLPTESRLVSSLVGYIQSETMKRLQRNCETLSRIEGTIDLLRKIDPPPTEAVKMLISTANHIQVELRAVRGTLTALLDSLQAKPQS